MKNMILLTIVALLMTVVNAKAEVYECASEKQGKYLLALQSDSGLIFRHQNGYLQELESKVQVVRAMDGGPVFIRALQNDRNDWGSGECYVMRTQTLITVKHSSRGDTGSTIQFVPEFELNPDQTGCDHRSLPRPLVLPPQPIKCTLR